MLSELEHAVLGVVWLHKPCTPYRVRKVFRESPSGHWSGSAGSIYPLMRRLEAKGLLRSARRRRDLRAGRLYELAKRGRAELVRWLEPPLPPASDLMNFDPLRVRIRFLGASRPSRRPAMVAEAIESLRSLAAQIQSKADADRAASDVFRMMSHRGALLSVRAQITWLKEVHQTLKFAEKAR
ncbi:MAG: PadR family transcriptional regulator [Phycisphaerae bacterium]